MTVKELMARCDQDAPVFVNCDGEYCNEVRLEGPELFSLSPGPDNRHAPECECVLLTFEESSPRILGS